MGRINDDSCVDVPAAVNTLTTSTSSPAARQVKAWSAQLSAASSRCGETMQIIRSPLNVKNLPRPEPRGCG